MRNHEPISQVVIKHQLQQQPISASRARRSAASRGVHCVSEKEPTMTWYQGRLNQWAHWAHAQGPRISFSFWGAPTGCGEINFLKLIILLLLMLLHDRTNTSSAYLVNLHTVVHGYCTRSVLLSLVYCVFCFAKINCKGNPANRPTFITF